MSLDESESLTGRTISSFRYKGICQKVLNWQELFESVIKILHHENESVLYKLADLKLNDNDFPLLKVSRNNSGFKSYVKIEQNLYVEKTAGTDRTLSILRYLFKLYKESPSDLVMHVGYSAITRHSGRRYMV